MDMWLSIITDWVVTHWLCFLTEGQWFIAFQFHTEQNLRMHTRISASTSTEMYHLIKSSVDHYLSLSLFLWERILCTLCVCVYVRHLKMSLALEHPHILPLPPTPNTLRHTHTHMSRGEGGTHTHTHSFKYTCTRVVQFKMSPLP